MEFIESLFFLILGVVGVVQAEESVRITEEYFTFMELPERDSGPEGRRNAIWFTRIIFGVLAIVGAVGVIRALF